MKKALSLIFTLVLCQSLCACGGGKTAESPYEAYAKYEELFMYLETNDYDNANAYIQNFFGISEVEPTETVPVETEPMETEPTYTTVEISLDNWQEYFELRNVVKEGKNDFGELTHANFAYRLFLKEKYISKVEDVDVALEYYFSEPCLADIEYSIETGEFVVGEAYTEAQRKDKNYLPATAWLSKEGSNTLSFGTGNIDKGVDCMSMISISKSFKITDTIATWCSTLYQNVEITRVQGTITIAE